MLYHNHRPPLTVVAAHLQLAVTVSAAAKPVPLITRGSDPEQVAQEKRRRTPNLGNVKNCQ